MTKSRAIKKLGSEEFNDCCYCLGNFDCKCSVERGFTVADVHQERNQFNKIKIQVNCTILSVYSSKLLSRLVFH